MTTFKKKVCILGAAGVGKTSLVRRYVHSLFEDKYLSTIGVKIEKKTIALDDTEVILNIWDVAGEEEFFQIPKSYVTGAAGYLLVIDGTDPATLETGLNIRARIAELAGQLPWIALLNKSDRTDDWQLGDDSIGQLEAQGMSVLKTSAMSGLNVEAAFRDLAKSVIS
jgi:small GTP-binding protein